nr:uncharacterized protein LOC127304120 [Lolium perenne]
MAADIFDEYLRMGESTCFESMYRFYRAVIAVFGKHSYREPTVGDTRRLLSINESRGFLGMIGSIDCMHREWKKYPFGCQGQYNSHAEGCIVILEVVISQDVWIWLMQGKASRVSYEINGNEYNKTYYLADGIYPEWATLVKPVRNPNTEKAKMQDACKKDVEREFGVLQACLKHPNSCERANVSPQWSHPQDLQPACHSSQAMINLSLPSDTDSEGQPPKWRHWWDRAATPSSSSSPPMDDEEEDAIVDDGHDEEGEAIVEEGEVVGHDDRDEEEKEEDEYARWTRLEAEEAAEEAVAT